MAETLLSPGVIARENDQSFITQQPAEVGAAIIGPAALGPVEVPTLVTSFSEYTALFGTTVQSGSNEFSYLTSLAANNYFQSGGTSLLVTRVVPEAFTPASSSFINTVDGAGLKTGDTNAAALFSSLTTNSTAFTGSGEVTYTGATFSATGGGTGAVFNLVTDAGAAVSITASSAGVGYDVGDTITFSSADNGGAPLSASLQLSGSSTFNANDEFDPGSITFAVGEYAQSNAGATGIAFKLTFTGSAANASLSSISASAVGEGVKVDDTFTFTAADINTKLGGTSAGTTSVVYI